MAGNTILVVDDEQRMRKLVRDFLTKQNFRVLEAADGEEAVDVFMENKTCPKCGFVAHPLCSIDGGHWRYQCERCGTIFIS